MKNNHIYIIVPVYNVEDYLERCLNSILDQTYENFSLILVDDGSTDNSASICDLYASRDTRIHVIHKKNGGLSSARNYGIDYVFNNAPMESAWITFIDSDDWIAKEYLEVLIKSAVESDVSISICKYIRTSKFYITSSTVDQVSDIMTPEDFWVQNRTNATVIWGKLYKLYLFYTVRFPDGKIHEDEYVTYKILFKNKHIAVVPEALYFYFTNSNSIMGSRWNLKRLDAIDALKNQVNFFKTNQYSDAYLVTQRHLCQRLLKSIRYIEVNYPERKDILKTVKNETKTQLYEYAKITNKITAFHLWLEIRYINRIRKILFRETIFGFLKRKLKFN